MKIRFLSPYFVTVLILRIKPWILFFSLMVLFFGQVLDVQAQQRKSIRWFWESFGSSKEEYDENTTFHIGITLIPTTISNYVVEKNVNWSSYGIPPHPDNSYPRIGNFRSINSKTGIGVGLGIPVDYRLNERVNISLTPGFILIEGHGIIYSGDGIDQTTIRRQRKIGNDLTNFARFDLPLHFKVRSDHKYLGTSKNSYKLYLLGGMKYSNHLGAKSYYNGKSSTIHDFDHRLTDVPIIVNRDFFSYEMGLGFDIYFTYFKLSPEIKFSESIQNLLDKTHWRATSNNKYGYPNPFMNALDRLSLRSLQFSLIFE